MTFPLSNPPLKVKQRLKRAFSLSLETADGPGGDPPSPSDAGGPVAGGAGGGRAVKLKLRGSAGSSPVEVSYTYPGGGYSIVIFVLEH